MFGFRPSTFAQRALQATLLLVVLLALVVTPVFAASPNQLPPPPDFFALIQAVLTALIGMTGWANFLGLALAAVMKFFPAVTDTVAQWISFGANVLMFGVIGYLTYTGQMPLVSTLDAVFVGLAKILADILIVVGSFGIGLWATAKATRTIASVPSYFLTARQLIRPQ